MLAFLTLWVGLLLGFIIGFCLGVYWQAMVYADQAKRHEDMERFEK